MSWLLTLQDASFKGCRFECISTDDVIARDVAQYERPYVNGVETEDLGRKAREFRIQAVFHGLFYESGMNALLAILDEPGPGELVHPIYGSVPQAQLASVHVGHQADMPDCAIVDLVFIEHEDSELFASSSGVFDELLSVYDMSTAMIETVYAYASFVGALVSTGVGAAFGLVAQVSGIGGLAGGIMGSLRGLFPGSTSSATDYVRSPQAFGTDVRAAVEGLSDGRTYESLADWRSMTVDADTVLQIPATLIASENLDDAAALKLADQDVARVETVLHVAVAADVVDTASQILADQRDNPTLTPVEIGEIVGAARHYTNQAIEKCRQAWGVVQARPITEPLKSAAKHTQDLGLAVINMRPPLIKRQSPSAGNLHLLAHAWYGDYRRAEELLRLNPQIRNPNDISAGEMINAYAK